MELVLLIAVLIVCVLLFININALKDENHDLKYKIENLFQILKTMKSEIEKLRESLHPSEIAIKTENLEPKVKSEIINETKPVSITEQHPVFEEIKTEKPLIEKPVFKKPVFVPEKELKPTFWQRNPDLEKFVGENLINKIGIAILVLGIGFFVKFAIDQDWINEIGRVSTGIFCGGILLGIAHRLRNTYRPFSSVLIGGGIAIFYFTIAIAYKDYALFSKPMAFAMMVIITAFAVLLSIMYDRIEIAMIAIFGGFISPLFVSDGNGSYIALFTYLLILNVGMLVLAYFKRWNLVNITAYVFTVIIYGGWLSTKVLYTENPPYVGALIFATIFYIIFFLMNIINNLKENKRFLWTEFSIILSNSFFYFSAGMLVLGQIENGLYQGVFTILVGIFNLTFAYVLFKYKQVDANILYMLLGLVLSFATLAAPIQLEGSYITMFWAMEGLLLLWLAQKSEIQLMKLAYLVLIPLTTISLIMDWNSVYAIYFSSTEDVFWPLLNKGFITTALVCLSFLLQTYLLRREKEDFIGIVKTKLLNTILQILFVFGLYIGGYLELEYQLHFAIGNYLPEIMYLSFYNFSFATALFFYCQKRLENALFYCTIVISVVLLFKLFSADIYTVFDLVSAYFTDSKLSTLHFFTHTAFYGLVLFYFFKIHKMVIKFYASFEIVKYVVSVIYAFLLVYFFSLELNHQIMFWTFDAKSNDLFETHNLIYRIGFPILWGIASFIFMIIGMKMKQKIWRIISLVLFAITLIKLFIYDISEMGEAGKIIAFIGLGVILLVISFMYQKLKGIVIDENETTN